MTSMSIYSLRPVTKGSPLHLLDFNSLFLFLVTHSNGKLLNLQLELIGACFPLVDIRIQHRAFGEADVSFCIDENDCICSEKEQEREGGRERIRLTMFSFDNFPGLIL